MQYLIRDWHILIIVLLCYIPSSITINTTNSKNGLHRKFDQANPMIENGRSCYRKCDGTPKICYFHFKVEVYETMSCECVNGKLDDCFNVGCVTANGVERNMMTVNRQLPGTPINVCKNDRLIIDVENRLHGSELTIHWHGIHQKETPWMDGVPMVTQCPIASGNTFRYDFHVRESGTHYYHAHSGLHRSNGIFGALNVRQQNDPNAEYYDYDRAEHSILLSDWNNFLAEENMPGRRAYRMKTESILINGRGSFMDRETGNFTFAPMEVFYVERGKRHVFRIDNTASHNCPFEFSIENHRLTVIATDGYSIDPVVVDRVVSHSGERYDVVMEATNDSFTKETLIRVRALGYCLTLDLQLQEFARIISVDNLNNYTAHHRDREPLIERPTYKSLEDPTASYLNHPEMNCADSNSSSICITALHQKPKPNASAENLRHEEIEKRFEFELRVDYDTKRLAAFNDSFSVSMINNISSTHPPVPVLTQDDSSLDYCNADHLPSNCDSQNTCHCIHSIPLDLCKIYEFFVFDGHHNINVPVYHPIHLHGYGFQVLDMGTMEQYRNGQTAFVNSEHLPPLKDTVSVPHKGFVRLRFRSCNPGYWFLHCHDQFHVNTGMMAIIKVGEKSDMVQRPDNFPICGNYLPPLPLE
ncbi:laccase-2-like isoform X2 [Contarinia nasturtii]|uniref:laccase-2-like isoform X2 n=1 Tax=Contarinia nasturtii TaxID=265458 RepID=UPI0012D42DB5|nr:laccase-2-like isoform X2 [Contarinia nasturtii]